jgi:hypothetical protein
MRTRARRAEPCARCGGGEPRPGHADVAAQRGRHLAADRADDGLGDERRLGLLRLEPAVRARAVHEDRDRQDRDEVDPQVLQVGGLGGGRFKFKSSFPSRFESLQELVVQVARRRRSSARGASGRRFLPVPSFWAQTAATAARRKRTARHAQGSGAVSTGGPGRGRY